MPTKTSSRGCMGSAGWKQVPVDPRCWPIGDEFLVPGRQSTGSIRTCSGTTKACMWWAFWSNLGSGAPTMLGIQGRSEVLDRGVKPQLSYRCVRWPQQRTWLLFSPGYNTKAHPARVAFFKSVGCIWKDFDVFACIWMYLNVFVCI